MITSAEIRNRLRQMAIHSQGKLVATSFANSLSYKKGTHANFHILRMNHPENYPCTVWVTPKKVPTTLYAVVDSETKVAYLNPTPSSALANSVFIMLRNQGYKAIVRRITTKERIADHGCQ